MAGAVSGALIGALVGSGADELVGLLVEHRIDSLLDGFPDRLAQCLFSFLDAFGFQGVQRIYVTAVSYISLVVGMAAA